MRTQQLYDQPGQFEVCPALSSCSSAAPEVVSSLCSLRPRPGNTFLGRWRLCQCFRHRSEDFLLIIAAGVFMPRDAIGREWELSAPGRIWGAAWSPDVRQAWGWCPRPCDSGNPAPARAASEADAALCLCQCVRTWSFPVALGGSQPRTVTRRGCC